jgi:hypothetical protein
MDVITFPPICSRILDVKEFTPSLVLFQMCVANVGYSYATLENSVMPSGLLRVKLLHRDLISSLIEFHDVNCTRSSMGIIEQAMDTTLVRTSSSLSPSPHNDTHPKILSRNKGAKMVVDVFVSKKRDIPSRSS